MAYLEVATQKRNKLQKLGHATILAIETSCDETSAAVVVDGRIIKSNPISSQIKLHEIYGGVVPEIASRMHVEAVDPMVSEALSLTNMSFKDIDAIGVTYGPGLVGAVLTGVSSAKALAYALNLPLIPVNHIEGHICANYLAHVELEPPMVCLVVSGGHTHLIEVKGYGEYRLIGQTCDDAAGEAFDKVARVIGLNYPGGPLLDKLAEQGNDKAFKFPRANVSQYDFSFSGLKTHVINTVHKLKQAGTPIPSADIAACMRRAVVDVLVDKAVSVAVAFGHGKLACAGGVSANSLLRRELVKRGEEQGLKVYLPDNILCTDNAAMIGSAAYYRLMRGEIAGLDLNAVPSLRLF